MNMDAAFSTELRRLEAAPGSQVERFAAQRALVRYVRSGEGDGDPQASATEEWVRLVIALRRVRPQSAHITPGLLKQWKTKATSSTHAKRKCFLVETAALDALPRYPLDLEKRAIPKDQLVLPADIYTEGMLIIDDGDDRAKLNVLRVLHIECVARWSQQRPAQPFASRSCGSNDECFSGQEASASRPVAPVPLAPYYAAGVRRARSATEQCRGSFP